MAKVKTHSHTRSQTIAIASDHAGVTLKAKLLELLPEVSWKDLGPENENRVDYPDYAGLVAKDILSGQAKQGILICGSGIGMSIAANKFPGIRAALVDNPVSARLSREHNDSNVLCLGSRFTAPEYASEIVQEWLKTDYSDDSRHEQRLKKLRTIEEGLIK